MQVYCHQASQLFTARSGHGGEINLATYSHGMPLQFRLPVVVTLLTETTMTLDSSILDKCHRKLVSKWCQRHLPENSPARPFQLQEVVSHI